MPASVYLLESLSTYYARFSLRVSFGLVIIEGPRKSCLRSAWPSAMKNPDHIVVIDRFAPLLTHVLALLAELGEDDWARPIAAPGWSVKDVAAHLLGGDIWILSGKRDS